MRISKELVKQREDVVVESFKSNPGLTVKEVNELLKSRYGMAMALGRIYALKELVVPPEVQGEPTVSEDTVRF